MKRLCAIGALLAACCVGLNAYVLTGYKWPAGGITMNLQLGSAPSLLSDGSSSWGASAASALLTWNSYITAAQFAAVPDSAAPIAAGNNVNNIFFSNSVYGSAFNANALAVTLTRYNTVTGAALESDTIFNTAFQWDSYPGPLRPAAGGGTLYDFHRVALHEFGHTLGLTHPDQFGQVVTALMNSSISNLDQLAADDAAGAAALYGAPGAIPSAISVSPSSGSGSSQTFVLQYGDTAGATDLATAWVWFNPTPVGTANTCLLQYGRATNTLFLMNDAGSAWISAPLGAAGVLQNSQCSVTLGGAATAFASGTGLSLTLPVTFSGSFGGAKNVYLYASASGGAFSGWQARGTWTVPTAPPPVITADSTTPSAGTGATQTFALQYSDTAGATNLVTAWTWFNATFAATSANSCLVQYNRATNTLFLMNDAGTAFLPGVGMGSAGPLQNSQCAIALGGSSTAVPSGNTLTLNLAITFNPSFAGAKNVYLYAANGTGANSGWQTRGTWTVPGAAAPAVVTAVSATPNAGTGATQTFALQYSDTAGATDLSTAWTWINATFAATSANSCLIQYNRATNTLFLMNDAGTAFLTGAPLGSAGPLQNSQCAIALGGSSTAVPSGNTLTLNLAITFNPSFAGAKNVYLYAANGSAVNSGWQTRGTWTVPGAAAPAVVTAVSATPNAGTGATQTFALQYSDTAGATDLSTAWTWINATFAATSANSCLIQYNRATNTLFLMNDAGTAFLTGAALGSAGPLQNSQCAIALGGSSTAVPSGNTLTLNLAITFNPSFAGAKNVYMYAANGTGANSGWQTRGTWTVPGAAAPAVVTADSATPNAGTGATQTFALQYSDTAGATDLATAWTWINATFAATSANSCLIQYNRATNTLFLMNDAGTAFLPGAALGSAGPLQNSQCAIALGGSSTAVPSGTTLTLNLAVTFTASFAGAKNIYLYAANGTGANSGWQTRGTWTVPGAAAPAVVTAVSATPNAGTGATQTFALQYSDTAGATDLSTAWTWINATFAATSANSCLIQYNRATNTLFLMNDAGTAFLTGVALGSAGPLQNSQCAIALGGSSTAVPSGSTLTLNLAVTLTPAFAGAKNVYLYAANGTGVNSGWQTRGTWTVPGAAAPAVVTADSATPNAGTGATQTFALQYSDTAGATDLSTAWTSINATFAATSANSCLIQYNRATNTLFLMNDAGTAFLTGAALGSTGPLQNSQCAIALGGSSTAVPSGTTLTLNLAVTFNPSFAGAKNIYMYAANGSAVNSGWQTRGTWTVPGGSGTLVGSWNGTTAQGQTYNMTVDSAGVATLRTFLVAFPTNPVCGPVFPLLDVTYTPALPITGNSFSGAGLAGTFTSTTNANGTLSALVQIQSPIGVNCGPPVTVNTTWSATKP